MSEISEMYEQKSKDLQEELKNQSSILTKLEQDLNTVRTNISTIAGAIQAFNEAARVARQASKPVSESVTAEKLPLQGEVI